MSANPKKAFGDKKPPLGQMPLAAMVHGALAFYDGKGKYGNRNWRKNHVEAQTYVEAILRHVLLWANGEERARDTNVHNLGGVIASASLLLDAQTNGCLIDNRVKSQANCDLLHDAEKDIADLNAQHEKLRTAREAAATPAPEPLDDGLDETTKREMAREALLQLERLRVEWWEGTGDQQRALEPRIAGCEDLILNMVNGTFPPAKPFVPEGTDASWVEEVSEPEHDHGVMVSPPPPLFQWPDGTLHVRPWSDFSKLMTAHRPDEGGGP